MFLWAEAWNTAVYIQNRCPLRILKEKTRKELFTGVKPDVNHFRIFGCPIYIDVPIRKRTKLEPSNRKGLFLGYNETSKAYAIYILELRKTVVSKHVKFEGFASREAHEPIPMIKNEEREAPNVDSWSPKTPAVSSSGSQHLGEEETLTPSSSVRRPQWFTQILRDAHSMLRFLGAHLGRACL